MKHIMTGLVTATILLLIIGTIMTVQTRTEREAEVHESLTASVRTTLNNLFEDKKYTITADDEMLGNEEFAANFCQALLMDIETGNGENDDQNLTIKVDVAGVDYKNGLLSVRVTETFSYPLGGVGKTVVNATAVLDTDNYNRTYTETFLNQDGSVYKKYVITANEEFLVPDNGPWEEEGKSGYWVDENRQQVSTFPNKVKADYTYLACYSAGDENEE